MLICVASVVANLLEGPNFKMAEGPANENSPPKSPEAYHRKLLISISGPSPAGRPVVHGSPI